jgi:hypothetical protein
LSDQDWWQEAEQAKPDQVWYGLGTDLYDTISAHPEVDSNHTRLDTFLDKLEMEFVRIMGNLHKEDRCNIPETDHNLAQSLRALAKDPDWSLVQSGKTGQWIPIRVLDFIMDMEAHLQCYCNKIDRSQLD